MLTLLSWASLLCYLAALAMLWQYTNRPEKHTAAIRSTVIIATVVGVIFHAIELYIRVINTQGAGSGFSMSLGHSISLVALVVTTIFVLISMVRATTNLGLAILPTAILALLAGRWLNPAHEAINIAHPGFEWHIALGILTFAVLSLAFAQSLLILVQEKQLKSHHQRQTRVSLVALPALQSMETLLFQILWLGFVVLSITLALGLLVNRSEYGIVLLFNHHIVLTLLTWLAYAILLFGRHFFGWRGRQASIYTIICYSLFLIGYFGPRIVRELIIN